MSSDVIIHEPAHETITASERARAAFNRIWRRAVAALDSGLSGELKWKPLKSTRSLEASACMWAHLADLEKQVTWYGHKLTSEEWKIVISAGLKKQRVVPGIEGGFVALGVSTRKMSISEMAAMIELILAFGGQQGVKFTAPKWVDECKVERKMSE